MSEPRVPSRVFARASQEAVQAKSTAGTPQTDNSAYRLAFQDLDFLLREDLRPVRFQLELMKAQLLLDEAGIGSTFVFYGSARIPAPEKADALVAMAETPEARAARTASASSSYARAAARRSWKQPIAARTMSAPSRSRSISCCRTSRRPTLMSPHP
jgi:hypothetical protein